MKKLFSVLTLLLFILVNGCSPASQNQPQTQTGYPLSTPDSKSGYPGRTENSDGTNFSGLITATPDPLATPLIVHVSHDDGKELISIVNISDSEIDISGYMLYSEILEDRLIIPENSILKPNEDFKILNGKISSTDDGLPWKNDYSIRDVEDQLILLNRAGRIIYYFTYYP